MTERKEWTYHEYTPSGSFRIEGDDIRSIVVVYDEQDAREIVDKHNLWPELLKVADLVCRAFRHEGLPPGSFRGVKLFQLASLLSKAHAIEQPVEEGNSLEESASVWLKSACKWQGRANELQAKLASAEARLKEIHDAGTKWLDEVLKS